MLLFLSIMDMITESSTGLIFVNTTSSSMDKEQLHTTWIVIRVLSAINSAVFLYVAITQLAYCITRYKNASSERYTNAFNIMCALASVFVLLRVGFPIEEMVDITTDFNCSIVVVFKTLTYGLALTTIWLVLWLRQRVFYQSQSLESLTSPVIKFLSAGTAAVLVGGFVGLQILYYTTQKHRGTETGCLIEEESYTSYLWAIIYASTGIMQVCLLGLFVYPLIKHKQNMRSSIRESSSSSDSSLNRVIKRAAVTAAICIAMNLISALAKYVVPSQLIMVLTYISDVNLGVELLAIIIAFKSWRKRLFPMIYDRRSGAESKSFSV